MPIEYAAQTLRGVLDRLPGLDLAVIDDVVVGCSVPEKYLGFNAGRLIAQRAGLPDRVPAQTLTRFCSSGLQSIATAANAIIAGEMDVVVAGGVELMTGMDMVHPEEFQDPALIVQCPNAYIPMGMTTENMAEHYGIGRVEMEAIAVESHRKTVAGKFKEEIIPNRVVTEDGTVVMTEDHGIRPDTHAESLAKLKPCFKADGIVTAATSAQMTDGASFLVVMAGEKAESLGYVPVAGFVSFAVGGVPAEIMGIGPTVAVPKVMARSGLSVDDMDVIELNVAFASQALVCIRALGLPKEKVNPNGGTMALGHPLGATGTVLTCKLLSELKRIGGKYGLVTMCIGGGCLNTFMLESARLIIAHINQEVPYVTGEACHIRVSEVDVIIEADDPLPQTGEEPVDKVTQRISDHILELVPDGATIQLGIGKLSAIATASSIVKAGVRKSKILLHFPVGTAVTTARSEVQYVATKYGCVNLKELSIKERVKAIILLAHPEFRAQLEEEAKSCHLL